MDQASLCVIGTTVREGYGVVGIVSMTHPCVLLSKVSALSSLQLDPLLSNDVKMAYKILPILLASGKPEMTLPPSSASSTSSRGYLRHAELYNTATHRFNATFALVICMQISLVNFQLCTVDVSPQNKWKKTKLED